MPAYQSVSDDVHLSSQERCHSFAAASMLIAQLKAWGSILERHSSLSQLPACVLQKVLTPADDPRLVERVDLKTGQRVFVYRNEEDE